MNVRFYDVVVKATDFGENTASTSFTVIVVPNGKPTGYYKTKNEGTEKEYNDLFINMIDDSHERYEIVSTQSEWDSFDVDQ